MSRDATWAEEIRLDLGERFGAPGPYVVDRIWSHSVNGRFVDLSLRYIARDAFTIPEIARAAFSLCLLNEFISENTYDPLRGHSGLLDPAWVARRPGRRSTIARAPTDPVVREALMRRADFTCAGCDYQLDGVFADYDGTFAPRDGRTVLHLDHRLALARGGADHMRNLQVLCEDCNFSKGAR